MATSKRRQRFVRSTPQHAMTPYKLRVLRTVDELWIATVPQLCALLDMSARALRQHLLDLYHSGYAERMAIPRAALEDAGAPQDPTLIFGSAPILYSLSKAGARLLGVSYRPADFGPQRSLFAAHEIQVRDVRAWLERIARRYGFRVTLWRTDVRVGSARPDGVFILEVSDTHRLTGLLEVDRGTEHSPKRWEEKRDTYAHVFASRAIPETLGQSRARVICICSSAKRRDTIAAVIAGSEWSGRYWLTERATLEHLDLLAAVWRVPGMEALAPLIPNELLPPQSG